MAVAPERYLNDSGLLNSPRMHVWHHDIEQHGKGGQNFGIVLSVWDWLFGTAFWPERQNEPNNLGFQGMAQYPQSVSARIVYPFWKANSDDSGKSD